MTNHGLDLHTAMAALIDVAGRDTHAWTRVPVPLRAALAAVALAASARTVNGVTSLIPVAIRGAGVAHRLALAIPHHQH